MSTFHSRKFKWKNGLDLSDYNFDKYGISIQEYTPETEVVFQKIKYANRNGCCITNKTLGCTEINFRWSICYNNNEEALCVAEDYLCDFLQLASDWCKDTFDIEFTDWCNREYFTYASISKPFTCINTDGCFIQEFEFSIIIDNPEYYWIKSWWKPCREKCFEPQLYCIGRDWFLDDDFTCCDWFKETVTPRWWFCREDVSEYSCHKWLDGDCIADENKLILNVWWKTRSFPRIYAESPIECFSIINHTNGSEITLDWTFNNLVIEQPRWVVSIKEGCVNRNKSRIAWNGIKLDPGENCLTIEWVSDWKVYIQRYDTFNF